MSENYEIPKGWETVLLDEFLMKNVGTVDPSKFLDETFDLYSIPAYDSKITEKLKGCEIGSTKKIVQENDVLLSRIVPHIQRSWVVPASNGRRQIGSGEWIIFRGTVFVPQFMRYFLLSADFHKKFMTTISGVGGSLTRATPAQVARFKFSLPPLPEQQRIVAKIEELFSSLGKGIESLKTAQQQLKVYRQAVLKWAFEGKLTRNTDKNQINVRLEELCAFITKGTTPSKGNLFQKIGAIPFIKVYNLTFSGKLDFSINPTFVSHETHNGFLARSKVLPGDVLMNIVGPPLGKVSIVPDVFPEWNINQAVVRFRCKKSLYNKFLAYFLLAGYNLEKMTDKSKATAGQFNLTLEICRAIEIPILFSIEEQHAIVAEIESRLSVCDKIEESIEQSLRQAESLRQSILKKAFEGKLVPQDPSDEPASKLLERIKAEKEKTAIKKRSNN